MNVQNPLKFVELKTLISKVLINQMNLKLTCKKQLQEKKKKSTTNLKK